MASFFGYDAVAYCDFRVTDLAGELQHLGCLMKQIGCGDIKNDVSTTHQLEI